jgi:hypothetical protein
MAYDNVGVNALRPKPTGGRRRENMTLQEEKAFLAKFAKAAGAGELPNIGELKSANEKEIRHPTSNSTVYDLLARHEWRNRCPFHPDRNIRRKKPIKKSIKHVRPSLRPSVTIPRCVQPPQMAASSPECVASAGDKPASRDQFSCCWSACQIPLR